MHAADVRNVEDVLFDLLKKIDAGEAVDREALLAQHPEFADELVEFFDAEDLVARMAGPVVQTDNMRAVATLAFDGDGSEDVDSASDTRTNANLDSKHGRDSGDEGDVGESFGRYRIVKTLGEGAMGSVHLAEDTMLKREVALKLPKFGDDDPEMLERFLVEARAAANLRHSNICPVHDVGDVDGRYFITMAYIPGRPLSDYAKTRSRQKVRQIVKVVRKLALALQVAHDAGIVHRDVKPANVMIDQQGEPVVMDFGLARHTTHEEGIRLTRSGAIMGTPAYMSPEQVEGRIDDVGPASDQFSLGAVLYEMLTGELPFPGASMGVVMSKIMHDEPAPPSVLRPEVDPLLDDVCLRMMAKPIGERFDSLKDVAEALTGWLQQDKDRAIAGGADPRETAAFTHPSESTPPERPPKEKVTEPVVDPGALVSAPNLEPPPVAIRIDPEPVLDRVRPKGRKRPAAPSPGAKTSLRQRPPVPPWAWIAGGLGGAALLVFGLVFLLSTPEGTLRVEVEDGADVEVLVDGMTIAIEDSKWEDDVDAKEHRLTLKIGGVDVPFDAETKRFVAANGKIAVSLDETELKADTFEVARRGTTVLRIAFEPNEVEPLPGGAPETDEPSPAVAPFGLVEATRHQQLWANHLGVPVEKSVVIGKGDDGKDVELTMVLVPPGEFTMGASKAEIAKFLEIARRTKDAWAEGRIPADAPEHRVRITRPFYLGKYEVTQAQWQAVMNENPSKLDDDPSRPVEQVSWNDIQPFLVKLQNVVPATSLKFGLPTEAQWEYACRAGTTSTWYSGDDVAELRKFGWFHAHARGTTHPVGGLLPNAFGLYDMHGNVWEWCADRFAADYYGRSPLEDPTGDEDANNRSIRGGCAQFLETYCRSGSREYNRPSHRFVGLGFRLAASIDEAAAKRGRVNSAALVAGRQLTGHDSNVVRVMFTPDGKRVVSASNGDHHTFKGRTRFHTRGRDNSVRVWDVESGQQIRKFDMAGGSRYGTMGMDLSSDGRLVAVGAGWYTANGPSDPRVYVWEVASGDLELNVAGPGNMTMRDVAFSSDDSRVHVVRSGFVQTRSVSDGSLVEDERLEGVPRAEFGRLFWSPDAEWMVGGVSLNSSDVVAWSRSRPGKWEKLFRGHDNVPTHVGFSSDGSRILTCARDFSVRLWDFETASELRKVGNLDSEPRCAAFSPDERHFATGSADGTVALFETETGRELARVAGHTSIVRDVAFSPDGTRLATAGEDMGVQLWTVALPAVLVASEPPARPEPPAPPDPPAESPKGPPQDAQRHGDSHFKAYSDVLTWHEAKKRCEELGGRLVVVDSKETNDFVLDLVRKAGLKETWIGATDEEVEGNWRWVDGPMLDYENWGPSQPNNKNQSEHYAVILAFESRVPGSRVGQWSDQPDKSNQHSPGFVCEWPDAPKSVSKRIGDRLFGAIPDVLSWHEAKKRCEELGGRLAIVDSDETNDEVVRMLQEAGLKKAWLGATDEKKEGDWRCVDGTPLEYANWYGKKPQNNGGLQHYLVVVTYSPSKDVSPGDWFAMAADFAPEYPGGFVCEWPAAPVAKEPFDAAEAKRLQSAWAAHLGLPAKRDVVVGRRPDGGDVTLRMVLVPPGEFTMGSDAERRAEYLAEARRTRNSVAAHRVPFEGPPHLVRITEPFYMAETETTQAQWQAVMGSNPSRFSGGPNRPVEQVAWNDVVKMADAVSALPGSSGLVFGLPTEAQWEYACRAGTTTTWYHGDDVGDHAKYAWYGGNSGKSTHDVGHLEPNNFGLFDMHGNVFEHCADWQSPDYYASSPTDDPTGPSAGTSRIHRGGDYWGYPGYHRSAHRGAASPNSRGHNVGFRLAARIDSTGAGP